MKDETRMYYNVQKYYEDDDLKGWYSWEPQLSEGRARVLKEEIEILYPEDQFRIVKVTETKHYEVVE